MLVPDVLFKVKGLGRGRSYAIFSPELKCGLEAHLLKVSETAQEEASGKQTRSVGDGRSCTYCTETVTLRGCCFDCS